MKARVCSLTALAFALCHCVLADPGTAFTYQGRLTDNGAPVTGTVDLRFSLWDDPSAGFQQGPTLTIPAATVTAGLFRQQLDFGAVVDGTALYLQIEVDGDGGADSFTPLTPRRELAPEPYAIHAQNAVDADTVDGLDASAFGDRHSLDAADGAPADVVFVDNSGLTGVGTVSPGAGLHVATTSDQGNPTILAFIRDNSSGGTATGIDGARDFAISGSVAAVISIFENSLTLLDISNPAAPTELSVLRDNDSGGTANHLVSPFGVAARGNHVFVTSSSEAALSIFDISNPSAPTESGIIRDNSVGGTATLLAGATGVAISGSVAYVVSGLENSLSLIDVSDPAAPVQLSAVFDNPSFPALGGASGVFVEDGKAYVTASLDDSLSIIDVSNPFGPVLLGVLSDNGVGGSATMMDGAIRVTVAGDIAFVTSSSESALTLVDVSNPASPAQMGVIADDSAGGTATSMLNPTDLVVCGSRVYVGSITEASVTVIDVSNPALPQQVAIVPAPGGVPGVELYGGNLLVAEQFADKVNVYDLGNPLGLRIAGSVNMEGNLTAGASALFVDASGHRVGIGTLAPTEALDVSGNVVFSGDLEVSNSTLFVNSDTGAVGVGTRAPTERLEVVGGARIDGTTLYVDSTSNRVGLGTTAPVHTLDVAGSARVANDFFAATSLFVDSDLDRVGINTSVPSQALDVVGGARIDSSTFAVDSVNNRVGIGTTAPAQQLDVVGSARFDLNTLNVDAANNRVGVGTSSPAQPLDVVGNAQFDFGTLFVDAANNEVGIGTLFPSAPLDVAVDARFDLGTLFVDASANAVGVGTTSPGANLDVLGTARFDFGTLFVDAASNRVGIGTTAPAEELDVNGDAVIGDTLRVIASLGRVAIGTTTPLSRLHVAGAENGSATVPGENVAYLHNTSTGTSADVLLLEIGTTGNPGTACNFITFMDGDGPSTLGSIQGNGAGSVELAAAGNDYAEWLPRLDVNEFLESGDVVGIFGGRITRRTDGADAVMVLSSNPIVTGNTPGDEAVEPTGNRVAFVGQALVKVHGPVALGDYIVASGEGDGVAVAVRPESVSIEQSRRSVGRAWEGSDDTGVKLINTLVGVAGSPSMTAALVRENAELEARVSELEKGLERMEKLLGQVEVAVVFPVPH